LGGSGTAGRALRALRIWLLVAAAVAAPAALGASGSPAAQRAAATPRSGDFAGPVAIGGGRELFMRCAGRGRPVVLLESGIHDSSDPWTITQTTPPVPSRPAVMPALARRVRVFAYDRPGTIRYTGPAAGSITTRSTPVPMPRTLAGMVGDLDRLVTAARLPAPYVLVGHSYGGLIVRHYAQVHPRKVAGLVLLDAFSPPLQGLFGPALWRRYAALLNRPGTPLDDQPGWETVDTAEAFAAVRRGRALPPVPLAVVSKTEPFAVPAGFPGDVRARLERAWPRAQDLLVALRPQTPHVFATGSDHYVQLHDPDLSAATVEVVLDRARAARR
jgi:pimeloyl-ACP methyl ester carboxylesterase